MFDPVGWLLGVATFVGVPLIQWKFRPQEPAPTATLAADVQKVVQWGGLFFQHISEAVISISVAIWVLGGLGMLLTAGGEIEETYQKYCSIVLFVVWVVEWLPIGLGSVLLRVAQRKHLI